jgi:hypothetical protein
MDLGTDPIVIVPDYEWIFEKLRAIVGMTCPPLATDCARSPHETKGYPAPASGSQNRIA